MTKLEKIRKVYGSFSKAVGYYADIGASMNMTARALDMDRRHFLRTVRRFGLRHIFKTATLPECQPGGLSERNMSGLRKGSERRISDKELLEWVAKCRTCRDFNARSPYNIGTIFDRFGSWYAAKDIAREQRRRQRHVELYGVDSWREHAKKATTGTATRTG